MSGTSRTENWVRVRESASLQVPTVEADLSRTSPAFPRHEGLNTEPSFESEAQEVFTVGARVFDRVIPWTLNPKRDYPEGEYLGRDVDGQAVVQFDGEPVPRAVGFDTLRNLYR